MSWEERPYAGFGGGRSFSDNPLNWAPKIGQVAGIRIRVHILFILFIGIELLIAGRAMSFVAQWLVVLWVSVLLHEFGHCFAARRVGGRAEEILMWPLGGLAMVDAPRAVWPQFFTVVCGPLVNVVLFVIAWSLLRFDASLNLMEGWRVPGSHWSDPITWLHIVMRMNLVLLLFNLWPMYPMDGGRMFQCLIWPWLGYQRSLGVATTVGMVAALLLGLYGLMTGHFLFVGIAIMGYMYCYSERQMLRAGMSADDNFMGYDFSGGYATVEKTAGRRDGLFARWRRRRAEAARQKMQLSIVAEQQEVDRILEKVHRQGMHSLTRSEKRTLQTATRRQQDSTRHRV